MSEITLLFGIFSISRYPSVTIREDIWNLSLGDSPEILMHFGVFIHIGMVQEEISQGKGPNLERSMNLGE